MPFVCLDILVGFEDRCMRLGFSVQGHGLGWMGDFGGGGWILEVPKLAFHIEWWIVPWLHDDGGMMGYIVLFCVEMEKQHIASIDDSSKYQLKTGILAFFDTSPSFLQRPNESGKGNGLCSRISLGKVSPFQIPGLQDLSKESPHGIADSALTMQPTINQQPTNSPEVLHSHWKMMVGRLLSFWDDEFSGASC